MHIEFETMNYMNSKKVRFMWIIQLPVYVHHSWSAGLSPTTQMDRQCVKSPVQTESGYGPVFSSFSLESPVWALFSTASNRNNNSTFLTTCYTQPTTAVVCAAGAAANDLCHSPPRSRAQAAVGRWEVTFPDLHLANRKTLWALSLFWTSSPLKVLRWSHLVKEWTRFLRRHQGPGYHTLRRDHVRVKAVWHTHEQHS